MKTINWLFLCFMSLSVFAQSDSKNPKWIVGGNIGYSTEDQKDFAFNDVSITDVEFSPYLAYMLDKRWAVGLSFPYTFSKWEFSDFEEASRLYGIGGFARYSFIERE